MNSYLKQTPPTGYVASPYSDLSNNTAAAPTNGPIGLSKYPRALDLNSSSSISAPAAAAPQTMSNSASGDDDDNDDNVGSVGNVNNWGVILSIFFLYPLFAIKVAEAAFATKHCSQVDMTPTAAEQCENHNIRYQNFQYLTVLVLGCIGVVGAILLAKSKKKARSAAFGLCWGSFATIVYAVCANYSRLTALSQVSILALLLASFIFLPPLTKSILLT